jgi:hypothetical protein
VLKTSLASLCYLRLGIRAAMWCADRDTNIPRCDIIPFAFRKMLMDDCGLQMVEVELNFVPEPAGLVGPGAEPHAYDVRSWSWA